MRRHLSSRIPRKRLGHWGALLAAGAVAILGVREAVGSRFLREKRAALAVRRALVALDAGQPDLARSELHAALQLRPDDRSARKRLAALELAQGREEPAFLAYQSLTEMRPEDPDGWIGLARLMVRSGLLEAPEATLDNALEVAPGNAVAHGERGEIRFRLGRYHGALKDAQAAVEAAPEEPAHWNLLIRAGAHAEAPDAGVESARRAPESVRNAPPVLLPLSALLLRTGHAAEARALLEKAALAEASPEALGPPPAVPRRLRPDAQVDRSNLGAWAREYWPGRMAETRRSFEQQLQQHEWGEAQRIADSAAAEFPGSIFGPFLAGLLELQRGDLNQAEQRLSVALQIAPRSPVLVATLGRIWARKGGAAYAAGRLMTLAERDPEFSIVRYIAARAYIEAGDPLRAEGALRRGLELQPGSPVPYQHLTDYDFGLDRVPEALQVAREGIARFPQATNLQMMLAQIQSTVGQAQDAIQTYRMILSRRPDLDLASYRLAMLLATQPDPNLHRQFLETLALLANDRPSDPQLLDALGWMHHLAGRDDLARQLLELAVERSPDEPSTRFHLGSVYLASGENQRGREELGRAVDTPRPFPERLEAMRLLREQPRARPGRLDSPRH
jgi:predicted Zn-dependent protease